MADDPFKPLGEASKPKLRVVANAADLTIVSPIPSDAPPASKHQLGEPTHTWIYRDAEGRELGFALRFDRNGEKEFRPRTLWRKSSGELVWRWSSWPEPRPLFGLEKLAARPSAPVIVTEGEKAADAAQRLLPDFVAVTSPGGSNAAGKAAWGPLAGRTVVVWRDADKAGETYEKAVVAALVAIGASSVAVVSPPAGVAEGWDAADALAEGWPPAKAGELVRSAAPAGRGAGRRSATEDGAAERAAPKPARGLEAIIDLIDGQDVEFWRDADRNAYVTVRIAGHRENYPIEGRAFAEWLVRTCYLARLTLPSANLLKEATVFFGAKARFEGIEKTPIRRSGRRDGKVYLDLGEDRWRVVEIDEVGWRILEDHNVPITRSSSLRPLSEPEAGASIGDMYRFLNCGEDAKMLVVAWILMALAGAGPYPILAFHGEEGAAKSSMSKLVRNLIDANKASIRAMPKEEKDLLVSAVHSHVLAFDNISNIDGEMSDRLCRVATGGGMSSRQMYTDADERVIYVRNPVILNGIPSLASRPDLASRTLLISLDSIPDAERMTEHEFEAEWAAAAPGVLGVLLDALSCALRKLPDTKLLRSGRMADFEQFVEAASSALEWEPGSFSDVMQRLRKNTDAVLISENEVAAAIEAFMNEDTTGTWEGTASALLERLGGKVNETTRRARTWPANATSLGKTLARLGPLLRRQGIDISRGKSGDRFWKITSSPVAKEAAHSEADQGDKSNA